MKVLLDLIDIKAMPPIEMPKVPKWHKGLVRKRVANSEDSDFTPLAEAFKKLKL